jgi:HEAT repeat protein
MALFKSKEKLIRKYLSELKNHDPEVRRRAAHELSKLGKADAISHLISALSDRDKRVRWRVAYALADFGEREYDDAYEALVSHLKNESDWNVRRIIVMSLRHWDDRAIAPLIKALSDESEYVRRYAAMTLGFKMAGEAIPQLKQLAATDESKVVRDYSKWALEKITKES